MMGNAQLATAIRLLRAITPHIPWSPANVGGQLQDIDMKQEDALVHILEHHAFGLVKSLRQPYAIQGQRRMNRTQLQRKQRHHLTRLTLMRQIGRPQKKWYQLTHPLFLMQDVDLIMDKDDLDLLLRTAVRRRNRRQPVVRNFGIALT